jgi:uncharacterized membrane protein
MIFLLLTAAACQSGTDAAPTPAPAAAPANTAPGKPVAGEAKLHPAAEPASAGVTHWQCDAILLDLREEGDTARIDFSGRSLTLQHGESLVGARYSDGKGNAFTRDGDHATLALAGESHACTLTDTVSPWNSAATRGVTFRAVGNEPGWWVEISGGTRPALHAALDYGDRLIDAPELVATRGRFSGHASDGAVVLLTVERGECRDAMSGAAFEASATLAAGSQVYRGCGAFLDD